jgi:PilZ domain
MSRSPRIEDAMGYVRKDDAIRRWPRASVELRGDVTGRARWDVAVVDLSLGGCLIRCPVALDRGAIVDLQVSIDGRPLAVKGRVAHASLDGDSLPESLRYLLGVEFMGVRIAEERELREFLDRELRRGAVTS